MRSLSGLSEVSYCYCIYLDILCVWERGREGSSSHLVVSQFAVALPYTETLGQGCPTGGPWPAYKGLFCRPWAPNQPPLPSLLRSSGSISFLWLPLPAFSSRGRARQYGMATVPGDPAAWGTKSAARAPVQCLAWRVHGSHWCSSLCMGHLAIYKADIPMLGHTLEKPRGEMGFSFSSGVLYRPMNTGTICHEFSSLLPCLSNWQPQTWVCTCNKSVAF